MPAGIASSVTVAWWASSAMSGQYSSRLGSDGPAMASVTRSAQRAGEQLPEAGAAARCTERR